MSDTESQTPNSHTVPAKRETSVHPIVVEIAVAAAIWFVAVTWLDFARGPGVDLDLAVVTLFFVIFFALFLLTATYGRDDPRWHLPATSFHAFLRARVGTATGPMRGTDVLLEIALVPVSLALAATLIGLVWVVLH
jgi:hypothetical protein